MEQGKKTWIYRLTHYKNLPCILDNGLHCPNSTVKCLDYINIGFKTLIASRGKTKVKAAPFGVLNDYIPFYFCSKSPMLFVISQGQVPDCSGKQEDLIYLVSQVERIVEKGLEFIFTDRHAKLHYALHFNKYDELKLLDWSIINSPNWGRQYGEERKEIKQAEFLVKSYLPVDLISGIICHNEEIHTFVKAEIEKRKLLTKSLVDPKHYF